MKTQREQIEEMAYSICGAHDVGIIKSCATCKYKNSCEKIIYARMFSHKSYRKASDVIDEFVERLKQDEESVKIGNEWKAVVRDVDIERISAEMRQEVENGKEN